MSFKKPDFKIISKTACTLLLAGMLSVPVQAAQELPRHKPAAPPVQKEEPAQKITQQAKGEDKGEDSALSSPARVITYDLPAYGINDLTSTGAMRVYNAGDEDTLLDIARSFHLGYVEIRAANPAIDPWMPLPGQEVLLPTHHLLPRAPQQGIVVNLGAMRLFRFLEPGKPPISYPIGIGREGLETPVGETSIIRKVDGPTWFPTDRMREEKKWLPISVPAGPANPLGSHALYLGWPTFLIHGTNKPWGIGRRLSSGCMRMYPEDIAKVFDSTPVGAKVSVVEQPVLVAMVGNDLMIEAHPDRVQSYQIESGESMSIDTTIPEDMKELIIKTAGKFAPDINWDKVVDVLRERQGYPIPVLNGATVAVIKDDRKKESAKAEAGAGPKVYRYNY